METEQEQRKEYFLLPKGVKLVEDNKITFCVMCQEVARFIAKETDEALCYRCMENNEEAKRSK